MAYSDNPGMRGLGASMSYGDMPNDMYLRKIEKTDMYEDPEQVNNHLRSLLVDFKPDKPFLASDEARHPNDRGGGFHSKRFLNLRHHGVAGDADDPYLPDGTYLGHIGGGNDRDPRGSAIGPDMRKHRDQQMARGAFIKFSNDNDYSVPEQGISPETMVNNIKSGMYMFKDRYQNFETAKDSWHNGGTGLSKKTRISGDIAKITMDGTVMDLTDATQGNRQDATAQLSSDPTIAYRHSTPDHKVKIAKYGAVRANQFLKDNNWQNNRQSAFMDHNMGSEINGQMVNKQLANLIIDVEGIRKTKQVVAQGAEYSDSEKTQIRSKKLHPDDVYKILMITGSQVETAHQQFDGKLVKRYAPKTKYDNNKIWKNVTVNHKVLYSLQQANRTKNQKEAKDLRESIEESAAAQELFEDTINRQTVKYGKGNRRKAEDNRTIEDSRMTKTYAGVKPSKHNRVHNKIDVTDYNHYSLTADQRLGNRNKKSSNNTKKNEYEQDRDRLDFGIYDKATLEDSRMHMGRALQHMRESTDDFGEELGDQDLL